ncbi:alpha-(1-_3)-arabinofuranosyltransferase domain-containing protein [Corynebacterium tapiri]|uniref:DUF3367 domain-containing protein n=1 Tax=Corynebacterium tapiri TaxID=1448266 RepID=A0A5C4U1K9_9CORY|nr:alpha-(1->3)-arabinofuranosyltransferase family protein [Corynebacterium tapiri]TNL95090.1 DUF3367 domain-containing protein [Corynebacterium tapiri]
MHRVGPHAAGWAFLALVVALLPAGYVAADTKLDLVVNPSGFLAQALHAYTPTFTLGQLQNQAYGYLFPHGLFFLLLDPLPDWIAQRLWWLLVTGIGYSGFLVMAQRANLGSPAFRILGAGLYALSPHTLTTLTAISSETWPSMLAPWIVAAALSQRLNRRALAAAVLPVAMMGAVNASATLLACVPGAIVLLWRGAGRFLVAWLAGCAAVSLWWIGPLVLLGRYSPPFTDFIESAAVTNRWLNPAEILRGTTSWTPFVDTERTAGHLLATHPVFILVTMALAALGLIGLVRVRGPWLPMLFVGVAVLGAAHGPFGAGWVSLLDAPLAAFRNIHKADLLVRIPLCVGIVALGSHLPLPQNRNDAIRPARRHLAAAMVIVIGLGSLAPALTGRLLPRGSWQEIPAYWHEATDFINASAGDTRTLIAPQAQFARQDFGWTRDEPAQPLLDVPWAVRDAIPLVNPEAIRGLDGAMAMLKHHPEHAADALSSLGIGALIVREDLEDPVVQLDVQALADSSPQATLHTFGPLSVILFHTNQRPTITTDPVVSVAGSGEVVPMLSGLLGPATYRLDPASPQIVTDTPLKVARNYGTLNSPVSAPLARDAEGSDVLNRVRDYPSVRPPIAVEERGGRVVASSSASEATAFGGSRPERSLTAAVDGDPATAWYPTPGPTQGQWIELHPDDFGGGQLRIQATKPARAVVTAGGARREVELSEDTTVHLPAADAIRVTLVEAPTGIAELELEDAPLTRRIVVDGATADTQGFFLQRLAVDTGRIDCTVVLPRAMELRVRSDDPVLIDDSEHQPGDLITLEAGEHRVQSRASFVALLDKGFAPSGARSLYLPGLSFNPGLRAQAHGRELESVQVSAGMQAFEVPTATRASDVEVTFAPDATYRTWLIGGGILALLVLLLCIVVVAAQLPSPGVSLRSPGRGTFVLGLASVLVVGGVPGLVVAGLVLAIRRFTVFTPRALIAALMAMAGAWLARAPWPQETYAGDSQALALVMLAALACTLPGWRR